MRARFHSDNGAPCWRCTGTIFTYTVDDGVSYVALDCIGCKAHDAFYPPAGAQLDCAANVSSAHRAVMR